RLCLHCPLRPRCRHAPPPSARYTLSLHDALPIYVLRAIGRTEEEARQSVRFGLTRFTTADDIDHAAQWIGEAVRKLRAANHYPRSEEHTSELQSRENLVCRLLLEKKKRTITRLSM